MNKDKSFLRHEILNLITLINFHIAEANLKAGEKSEILEKLRMLTLLCANEDFILGNKKEFSRRESALAEILELTDAVLRDELKKSGFSLTLPATNLIIKGDRQAVMKGLEQIIQKLLPLTKKIDVKVDEKKRKLSLHYDSNKVLCLSERSIIEILENGAGPEEAFFEIYVGLMKMSGVKTNFKKGVVEVLF